MPPPSKEHVEPVINQLGLRSAAKALLETKKQLGRANYEVEVASTKLNRIRESIQEQERRLRNQCMNHHGGKPLNIVVDENVMSRVSLDAVTFEKLI